MNKPIIYGLYTAIGLMAFFLLMKVAGQEANVWLRLLNGGVLGAGIYLLFRSIARTNHDRIEYFDGLKAGVILSIISVVVFMGFLGLYVTFFDPTFVVLLEESKMWGTNLTKERAAFALIVEGVVSGMVLTFIMMQFFKKNRTTPGSM